MNENNLSKILVENNNGKIIGIIDEANLLKCVMEKSFKEKIKKYVITKFKLFPIIQTLKNSLIF